MKIQCLIDLGDKGYQKKILVLKNSEDIVDLQRELDGTLPYDREFLTDEGKIVLGSQIIQEIKGGKNGTR